MSEWFKEHAWKACKGASSSQVRILFLPPNGTNSLNLAIFSMF